eukprot:jgi/Ulvmu1/5945/UM026_0067.1
MVDGNANDPHTVAVQAVREFVKDIIADKAHLQMFCSDDCILRFLRARNMDHHKAARMLAETLHWREEFHMHQLKFQDVADQATTGKVMIAKCKTYDGRPVLLLRPGRENNTKDQDQNLKHFAYQMESVTRMADRLPGDGKIMSIVDYTGWTLKKSPPMKTSMATLKILQHHYPERLHLCICWHPPAVFSAFWKLLSPFIDPVTAQKVTLLPKGDKSGKQKLAEHLDTSQLDTGLGGSVREMYDFGAWQKMLMAEDHLYQQALASFTASQAAAQPALAAE